MFWDVRRVESRLLPPTVTLDPADSRFRQHVETRVYPIRESLVERVTARVRIRPVDFDVIDDLIASGDLAPELREKIPTFTLSSTVLEWRQDMRVACVP